MKNLITVILVALLSAGNLFPQFNKNINQDKILKAEVKIADEFSSRISPLLHMVVNRAARGEELDTQFPESAGHTGKLLYLRRNETGTITVPVLIKSGAPGTTQIRISELGGITGTVAGDIITADVPVSRLKELSESPEVVFIDASTVAQPKLNLSRTEVKVDMLHNGTGISRPYKGNGVVVGIVDSGIDWKHLDFKNSGGNRIKYLWDMSDSTGTHPGGYSYGTEYQKAQLDGNQCFEIDADDGGGHGTHVAGTAAGNGGASATYTGMAPESDIVFVKGFRSGPGFASNDVVDGCNYIFQKAQQLGKPAVINLSLGGHFGPHDGTSNYEQAMSNLTGNGKIIVVAAGNEGDETIHLSYAVSGTSYENSFETFFEMYNNTNVIIADMWYNTGNVAVGLAAYNPSDFSLIGITPGITSGQSLEDAAFTFQGTTYGYVTIISQQSGGKNEVIVAIDGHGQVDITNVYWTLYTYGSGTFDAWVVNGGIFSTYVPQQWTWIKPGDNQKTIGIPGTSNKVICVGSYVTKNSWVDINGATQQQPGNPVIGKISSFSSLGPTRDGRVKPDIVAPGEVIIAAYSSFLTQTPASSIAQGGLHQKMQGTSMASPHVTGTVALLLEKNNSLNYDQAVTILKNTTKKDNFTGTTPNNTYGSGKMDAYNAFNNTSGGGGGGTQTILQEGFDGTFPPANWTKMVTNAQYTWIQSNPQSSNFNTIDPTSLYSALCPWVAQNQNEVLVSPPFNLGSGTASLEFYAGYSTQWLSSATIKLLISTDGGANWTQIWTADNDGQPWIWRKKTIDLTSYSGRQNIKLAWQYVGNDGDLAAIDGVKLTATVPSDADEDISLPTEYSLSQNYPNPFNPSTKIRFSIAQTSKVSLIIYDILGREIARLADAELQQGNYEREFSPAGLSSGIYFYRLKAGDFTMVRKMQILK